MIRVNVLAEGQSEMTFVKKTLNEYFDGAIILDSRAVLTSRDNKTNHVYRGGMTNYLRVRDDIVDWMKKDQSAYVSTMFDLFRLPNDFPGYMEASACQDHRESVEILEREMRMDILREIPQDRFLPYIQLHEFESLLFTDIRVLKDEHPGYEAAIQSLEEETKEMRPEEVDHERPLQSGSCAPFLSVRKRRRVASLTAGIVLAQSIRKVFLRLICWNSSASKRSDPHVPTSINGSKD